MSKFNLRNLRIGVVGLGYVGLPLAVEFGKRFNTVGFDIKVDRVDELKRGYDSTLETDAAELAEATRLTCTTRLSDLRPCRVFIVTVPTPIDEYKRPDLTPLVKAYASDQAFRVCEDAIQVYGGAGYCQDYPVEQYLRDSKIFSIYEGTNHIQALDLVGRKLGQAGGKHTQDFFGDIGKFVAAKQEDAVLGASVKNLAKAQEAVGGAAFQVLGWFKGGEMAKVPLNANRFLEMMSELAVGWLLLEGAAVAADAQAKLSKDQKDWAFYEGKKQAAIFYAHNVLPEVVAKAKMLGNGDKSALEIPDEAFATV